MSHMTLVFALFLGLQDKPDPSSVDLKVRAQGDPVVGRKPVPVEELLATLKARSSEGVHTVVLRIDSLTTFAQIQNAITACRQAGIANLELASKKFPPSLPLSPAAEPSIQVQVFNGPGGQEMYLRVQSEVTKQADLPGQLKRLGQIPIQFSPASDVPYKTIRKLILICVEAGLRNLSFAPAPPRSAGIRVLYLEDRPRKEFRSIYQMLTRSGKVSMDVRLIESEPGTPEFLDAFPRDLSDYEVVLIGDFRSFEEGDREELRRFVLEQGGGIVWMAPERHPTGWPGHDMPRITPLQVSSIRRPGSPFPVPMSLVVQDTKSSIVQDLDWDQLSGKVHFPWRTGKIDPGATVTVTSRWSASPPDNAFLVLDETGKGRSIFVGASDTWRWGKDAQVFWENALTWAAKREKKASD